VARVVGKTLIGMGVLILLFVAYQLWGTGLAEARSQRQLKDAFRQTLQTSTTTAPVPTSGPAAPTTTTTDPLPPPPTGSAVAILRIPRIGVTKAVVEGVGVPDLKKGPGHYPATPLPGQPGNAAIAGHRTTYGAPFYNLDRLRPGDPVLVTTRTGRHYQYDVEELKVVAPDDTAVVAATDDNRLTLTTCNPRYSAKQRLVVVAMLQGEVTDPPSPPAAAAPVTPPSTLAPSLGGSLPIRNEPVEADGSPTAGLGGDRTARVPTALWGLIVLGLGTAIWAVARRWRGWRHWAVYLVSAPVMAVVLFLWFQQVNRLLPANI
jgi:sortase A